jgi:tetratricopeptide (TPR) repeat protein
VVEILFDPDGRNMASVTRGQVLKFWEVSSGREDATASPVLRRRAARFAAEMAPDAGALNAEAYPVVLQPGRPTGAVQRALAQAREASRLDPTNHVFQGTLGLALCRAGQPREAVPLLRAAAAVLPKRGLSWFRPLPASLPALVIALYQAGDPAGAVGAAVRLRAQLLNERQGNEELVREAEELLFGPGAEAARREFWARLRGSPGPSPAQEAAGSIPPKLLALLEAERIFRELQPLRLRAKVAEALAARRDVSDESRAMVLAMVREMEESAGGLNSAAWEIAQGPGRPHAEYEVAVAQAEAAVQLEPAAAHLNTLGVAFYRAGRWRDAIDTLSRSRRFNPAGVNAPDDIAFLAMAYHRDGQPKRAAGLLDTLRQLARTSAEGNAAAGYLPEVDSVLNPR